MVKADFWCETCKVDFTNRCIKRSRNFSSGFEEWFETKHEKCGATCIRLITFPHKDKYFHVSKNAIIQRDMFRRDLLQPSDSDFKVYYRKQWEKMELLKQHYEQKHIREKKQREAYYKNALDMGANKKDVLKAMDIEEKMNYGK